MSELYNQIFTECKVYFGKDTKRFLDRQIKIHLSKMPETVNYSDKETLCKWINISASLVLNKKDVEILVNRISSLKNKKE